MACFSDDFAGNYGADAQKFRDIFNGHQVIGTDWFSAFGCDYRGIHSKIPFRLARSPVGSPNLCRRTGGFYFIEKWSSYSPFLFLIISAPQYLRLLINSSCSGIGKIPITGELATSSAFAYPPSFLMRGWT